MSQLPQQIIQPTVVDPKNVADTYCNGPINLNLMGPCGTITFTTIRPDPSQSFAGKQVTKHMAVVSSRVTTPLENLAGLRDLLNQMLPDATVAAPFLKQ